MKTIPVKTQVVDMKTGAVVEEKTTQAMVLPSAAGTCQECGVKHDLTAPHNRDSLRYQMLFNGEHGRSPTWADAMAHCPDNVKALWTDHLTRHGIDVNGGAV